MTKRSPFEQMSRTLAEASVLALAGFLYALAVIGAGSIGFSIALGTAFFIFCVTVFGGVVLYLE